MLNNRFFILEQTYDVYFDAIVRKSYKQLVTNSWNRETPNLLLAPKHITHKNSPRMDNGN